jgi:hypothetical protein
MRLRDANSELLRVSLDQCVGPAALNVIADGVAARRARVRHPSQGGIGRAGGVRAGHDRPARPIPTLHQTSQPVSLAARRVGVCVRPGGALKHHGTEQHLYRVFGGKVDVDRLVQISRFGSVALAQFGQRGAWRKRLASELASAQQNSRDGAPVLGAQPKWLAAVRVLLHDSAHGFGKLATVLMANGLGVNDTARNENEASNEHCPGNSPPTLHMRKRT